MTTGPVPGRRGPVSCGLVPHRRSLRSVAARAVVGLLAPVVAALAVAGPAAATWSIVAVDPETGQVGAAMASCVPAGLLGEPDQVLVPVVLVPGRAAAVTQGSIDPDAPFGLRQLLADGAGPRRAIDEVLAVDAQPTVRQFGVVVVPGTSAAGEESATAAAHTGADAEAARADATGPGVSAQGVLLASEEVVQATLVAAERALGDGRPLADALVAGLIAGAEAGGDRRCDEDQAALFAHLAVADPGDDPARPTTLLTVTVDEGDGQNPVELLSGALAEGRTGWVDAGLEDPVGIPRLAVLAVGVVLAVAAVVTLRRGLGNTSARR